MTCRDEATFEPPSRTRVQVPDTSEYRTSVKQGDQAKTLQEARSHPLARDGVPTQPQCASVLQRRARFDPRSRCRGNDAGRDGRRHNDGDRGGQRDGVER